MGNRGKKKQNFGAINLGYNWFIYLFTKNFNECIPYGPGDYCEGVIPDPIPNSEVKSFSADGTLS